MKILKSAAASAHHRRLDHARRSWRQSAVTITALAKYAMSKVESKSAGFESSRDARRGTYQAQRYIQTTDFMNTGGFDTAPAVGAGVCSSQTALGATQPPSFLFHLSESKKQGVNALLPLRGNLAVI
ncbi:MAG: hypothetical protein U0X92_14615 [Anaerolineales bacterium]